MKNTAIVMTAALLAGLVLSMGFIAADNGRNGIGLNARAGIHANSVAQAKAGSSLSLNDAENDDDTDDQFEIQEANEEIDSSISDQWKEGTFAQVSIGHGWAISSGNENTSEGHFARIFWVEKNFVTSGNESTNETNQTDETTETFARGTLKIGNNLYKIVLDSQTEDTMTFDVTSAEKGQVNGTLVLEAETSLLGFTVWTGELDMDSGLDWNIHVATQNNKVKGSVGAGINDDSEKQPGLKGNLNASENGQGKKIGLLARIRAWFGGD